MTNQNDQISDKDWEEIILSLQSYTRLLVKSKGWFRGANTTTFLKGKEIDDYVFGAIEKFLRNPEKYIPTKGTLLHYLKYNLIRSMVSNDFYSSENQTSKDVFVSKDLGDQVDSFSYLDSILPSAEVFFDQEIDFVEIINFIETEVKSDPLVENIFLGICCYGLKRREVIKEFNITEKEFDNGMRRLSTLRNNVAKKYDLKPQSL